LRRGERLRLAGALLLGAALAFPAGLWLAGGGEGADSLRVQALAERRDVFSPSVRDDPYVLDAQRANVAALEAHCRRTGEGCAEARQARAWLNEQAAD
jgi:hypothetical protein